ncbi:MAG: YqgE/AlgH family protein, partial [Thermoanaerobaculia bacterium]
MLKPRGCLGLSAVMALLTLLPVVPSALAQAAPKLAKGKLLVASEGLHDPNFEKTIVLLLNHDESGTLGLVLNRPSSVPLERLLPDFEGLGDDEARAHSLFVGGPVEIHKISMLFSTRREHSDHLLVLGDVYAGWDDELLRTMLTE